MEKITQRVAVRVEWLFGCTSLPLCLFCPVHLHRTVGFFSELSFKEFMSTHFFEVRCKLFVFQCSFDILSISKVSLLPYVSNSRLKLQ